ncbi:MAG: aminoglycoside phosphotransferase family protein [Candidatus Nealsonbacteria bacterium]|nr:MAG: aminoglycoside phosphotransferase family protein [Candidatus Nealsonbacteria bacterium]
MQILNLLDRKWVEKFLQNRFHKYFPKAEKLIDFKIKTLKIFLDHQRISTRYNLVLSYRNKNLKKSIIVKAEKKPNFDEGISRIKTDYLANLILTNQGLNYLIPRALEYYQPLGAFFYEPIEGTCLKQLSIEHRGEEFLKFIPEVATSLKKIHLVKNHQQIILRNQAWEKRQYKNYLCLMEKYYPFGLDRFKKLIQYCKNFRIKNKNDFSVKNYCLTHGDLHSGNIFISKRQIRFLDFSEARLYDPLSDLGCFFMHTELMLEYDFHANYQEMINKVKNLFYQNYFTRPPTNPEKNRVYYYSLHTLFKIIGYAALNENSDRKLIESNKLLEKLIKIGEEKINL